LGSSAGRRATQLREAHRERVARSEVRTSPLWAQPCRAYNVHIEPDPRAKASLGKVQRGLSQAEPDLLACPKETLHVSIAWLLAVHVSYSVPKDSLWERHGEEWTAELRRIAAQSAAFRITYEHVVATDSAVIALAQPSEPVNRIREMIRERLRLSSETRNEADLVHTTLFRYSGPLSDPEKFLAMLEDTSADATAEVDELVVSKELVYPSLEAEVLARLPLAYR
jgi:2'-5' RNA ligase